MKKTLFTGIVIAASVFAYAASKADNDPVLMSINGKDIKKSEFEYLYQKNNSQQATPQTIDEYLDMFINYKLKVGAAEAAGIDKSEEFLNEFSTYRNDLASPYMTDNSVLDSLINDAYTHFLDEVSVSHIMLPYSGNPEVDNPNITLLDSLRNEILAGRTTFEQVAIDHSIDSYSKTKGGNMGWVLPGRFPYEFEKASYDTPVGQISEIVKTTVSGRPVGLHIIRPDIHRPSRGEVKVQHILKLTRGLPDSLQQVARQQIDSIYTVVTSGADFSEVAKRESQDPGSAVNGGMLDWFSAGKMVAEFDSVAFALADGEISKPFATSFGYHIIKRLDHRGVKPLSEMRAEVQATLDNDERSLMPAQSKLNKLKQKFDSHILPEGMQQVKALIANVGQYDSVAVQRLFVSSIPVVMVNGVKYPVSKAMPYAARSLAVNTESGYSTVSAAAYRLLDVLTREAEANEIYKTNPEYRNLLNEYRDGILLFDISNTKVWDRASKDTLGLKKFFDANRDKYKWTDGPRFKSYIIFAKSDSIAQLALQYAESLLKPVNHDELVKGLRERFGKSDVKVERVIAPKGKNAITDYLAFGGPKPDEKVSHWPVYVAFQGRIIDTPEEPIDVKGAVTADYQAYLDAEWIKELRKNAKIKINKKVLESLK